jgi:membrane protein DedA with SNARE-associated domain
LGFSNSRFAVFRKKAPQLIAIAIIIGLAVYVSFELLEDVFVEGQSPTSGPLISAIINFTRDVTKTVASWGYPGIFGLMILESSSLPIPSEVVLPFSGYLVSIGLLNFWETVLVATAAAIVGSLIDYYIGLKGIEALAKKRILGRVIFSMDQLAFAAKWFQKYGSLTIFLARLVPGLRTIISFPAGAAKMPLPKFVVFTTAGCLVWNALLIYVGLYLGSKWHEVASFSEYILIAVIAALVALLIAYLIVRRRRRKARAQTAA